jgi:hypothetical protein
MEKPRELFETELAQIRQELLRLGVRPRESPTKLATVRSEKTVTPAALMTAAYELAGYAVATLALHLNIPNEVVLKEDSEYDVGRCTLSELDTIWAVGNMAGERGRHNGCSGEQGLIVINVTIENSVADGIELKQGAEVILHENWNAVVRIAQLLIEKGMLSRSELEDEVFGPRE